MLDNKCEDLAFFPFSKTVLRLLIFPWWSWLKNRKGKTTSTVTLRHLTLCVLLPPFGLNGQISCGISPKTSLLSSTSVFGTAIHSRVLQISTGQSQISHTVDVFSDFYTSFHTTSIVVVAGISEASADPLQYRYFSRILSNPVHTIPKCELRSPSGQMESLPCFF